MNKPLFQKAVLATVLTTGIFFLWTVQSRADETADLKNQVKILQDKVNSLEKKIADQAVQPELPSVHYYDVWDPFQEMRMIERQMKKVMNDQMVHFNPKQDIKETKDDYIINMDLPGMEKDKINVEIKSGMLVVSGERSAEVKEKKPNEFYRQERSFGNFLRTMPLPDDAKPDQIEAQYDNGVLTVKVPRNKTTSKTTAGQKIIVK